MISLTRRARRLIKPPWPDLVIGVGYGSVPVARYIRRAAGGATKLVAIGNPRADISDLDLVDDHASIRPAPAPNVLALTLAGRESRRLGYRHGQEEAMVACEPTPIPTDCLRSAGQPVTGRSIGRNWLRAIMTDKLRCEHDGGTIIVVTSPRTDDRTRRLLAKCLEGTRHPLVEDFPRFPVLLAWSDEIYVTADSVSMLAEAILTRKPVGMIPIAPSLRGKVSAWLRHRRLIPRPYPDLTNFWSFLSLNSLVGTRRRADRVRVSDTVSTAAKAVLGLLD